MGLITEDSKPGRVTEEGGLGRGTRRDRIDDEAPPYSSEITLGMRSMLGIFFGLVLVCGVFFGLGYSVGRNGGLRPAADDSASPVATDASLKKPSAQQSGLTPVPTPGSTAQPADTSSNPDQANPPETTSTVTEKDLGPNPPADETAAKAAESSAAANKQPAPAQPAATKPAAQPQTVAQRTTPVPAPKPAPPVQTAAQHTSQAPTGRPAGSFSNPYRPTTPEAAVQSSTPSAPGTYMVQIAAVRSPQDANILVGALQQRGFHAVVRHEPQDQLLHVQVGPFSTRAQAFDMRSKLLADGYNAMVK
jgi:cell division septation protein DedD